MLTALLKKCSAQMEDAEDRGSCVPHPTTAQCLHEIEGLKHQLLMSQRQLDVAVQNCQVSHTESSDYEYTHACSLLTNCLQRFVAENGTEA